VKRIHSRTAGRPGFTLIELLVVIAIIAILVGLTTAGVMKFLVKGPEAQTRSDILNLSAALQQFYSQYKFYPPDRVRLCSNYASYTPTPGSLDAQSLMAINKVWPNLGNFTGIAWAGPATPAAGVDVILEGDQALVFWLAGPPETSSTLMGGFAVNPTDPIYLPPYTAARPQLDRKRFMNFDGGRLTPVSVTAIGTPRGNSAAAFFPSYLDAFRKAPYVYFSSNGRPNGYSGTANTLGVSPYLEKANTFQKSNEFQIISAGLDGKFGAGGMIWPVTGVYPNGMDDFANFTDRQLGAS